MSIQYYRIKEVSEITGVHPQTLRNWEKEKLIEPLRVSGNHRLYSVEDLNRVQEIQGLKDQGLQIKGIQNFLKGKEFSIEKTKAPVIPSKKELTKRGTKQKVAAMPIKEEPKTTGTPTGLKEITKTKPAKKVPNSNENYLRTLGIKEISEMAKNKGVKYFRQMTKEELITCLAYPNLEAQVSNEVKERTHQKYVLKTHGELPVKKNKDSITIVKETEKTEPKKRGRKPLQKSDDEMNKTQRRLEELLEIVATMDISNNELISKVVDRFKQGQQVNNILEDIIEEKKK